MFIKSRLKLNYETDLSKLKPHVFLANCIVVLVFQWRHDFFIFTLFLYKKMCTTRIFKISKIDSIILNFERGMGKFV